MDRKQDFWVPLILAALIVLLALLWLFGPFIVKARAATNSLSIDPTKATANVVIVAQSPKAASSPDNQNKAMEAVVAPSGYGCDVVRCRNATSLVMSVYYALQVNGGWFNTGMRIPARTTNDVVIMKPAGQPERFYRLQQ